MYTDYFGLRERPFSITPDARYLYLSPHHREALAHLHFGIGEGGGFVQLTGDVGTGKTTVCRALLEQLPPHVDTALVLNPAVTVRELLQTVCEELLIDVPPDCQSNKTFIEEINSYLLDANARGRRSILIIDEAQNLSKEVLEQVRLLTNLETYETKLLQIFLIGQPELRDLLSDKGLRQVAQRVTARYHLPALDSSETRQYIQHRLAVAGCSHMLFSKRALRRVYRHTKGVPRLINILCDRALLGAYVKNRPRVSAAIVEHAFHELAGRPSSLRRAWPRAALATSGAAAAGLLMAWGLTAPWQAGEFRTDPETPNAEIASGVILGTPPAVALVSDHSPKGTSANTAGRQLPEVEEASLAGNEPPDLHASPAEIPGMDIAASSGGGPTLRDAAALADAPSAAAPGLLPHPVAPADRLLAEWGVAPRSSEDIPLCEWAQVQGLRCLVGHGDWSDLRRFNRPAIISLLSIQGEAMPVVVTAMTEDSVTLGLRGRDITFPLKESSQTWQGEYLLLWRPPTPKAELASTGSSGALVLWLREALRRIDGSNGTAGNSMAFDGALQQRIMAFQRSRNILVDGVVGRETLIHLNTALGDPAIPLLRPTPTS
ncbi:MAG: AAA family ATPase [Gammaproteobacteria bacterium]|nr:AAA family ATPase [Gammaproteobacteria bacterium]